MTKKIWGIFLLVLAFVILGFVAYKNSTKRQIPIIFSPQTELVALWSQYKIDYFEQGTNRVLDPQQDNITTSEGESYAMLRAVWLDDKDGFDKSWTWTQNNLQRSNDHLFSWKFGEKTDGTYGILTDEGGENTASDADTDIALALVFAGARWNNAAYLSSAQQVISGIWNSDVMTIKGVPYLTADNVEKTSPSQNAVLNPSYFAPYAYRIFSTIDPTHPWNKLVDSSYTVLQNSMNDDLDASSTAHIPPDWVFINKTTGVLSAAQGTDLTSNMGYDAMRVPFRLTLDWQWFKDIRAKNLLASMNFLSTEWNANNVLYTSYSHSGEAIDKSQTAAFYGGVLGYFMTIDPTNAKLIYDNKLQILFDPDTNNWKQELGYYDDNWAWFGIALYNNQLPNLTADITTHI